jgi:hypothetical protein
MQSTCSCAHRVSALARSRMNGREVEGTQRSRAHGPASPSRPGYEVEVEDTGLGCWAVIQQALAMRSRPDSRARSTLRASVQLHSYAEQLSSLCGTA